MMGFASVTWPRAWCAGGPMTLETRTPKRPRERGALFHHYDTTAEPRPCCVTPRRRRRGRGRRRLTACATRRRSRSTASGTRVNFTGAGVPTGGVAAGDVSSRRRSSRRSRPRRARARCGNAVLNATPLLVLASARSNWASIPPMPDARARGLARRRAARGRDGAARAWRALGLHGAYRLFCEPMGPRGDDDNLPDVVPFLAATAARARRRGRRPSRSSPTGCGVLRRRGRRRRLLRSRRRTPRHDREVLAAGACPNGGSDWGDCSPCGVAPNVSRVRRRRRQARRLLPLPERRASSHVGRAPARPTTRPRSARSSTASRPTSRPRSPTRRATARRRSTRSRSRSARTTRTRPRSPRSSTSRPRRSTARAATSTRASSASSTCCRRSPSAGARTPRSRPRPRPTTRASATCSRRARRRSGR